jgi:hypothetical protein
MNVILISVNEQNEQQMPLTSEDPFNNDVDDQTTILFLHETFQRRSGAIITKCKECKKKFNNGKQFKIHFRKEHKDKMLCWFCYQVFPTKEAHTEHMKRNHPKEHHCTLCQRKFSDETGLKSHFRAKHLCKKCKAPLLYMASC